MQAKTPSPGNFVWFGASVTAGTVVAILCWLVIGWNQWVFAYVFMGLVGIVLTGTMMPLLRWSIRYRYLGVRHRVQFDRYLTGTENFDITVVAIGIVERLVFTTLGFMLLFPKPNGGPFGVDGELGVLASIAGGWIVLKSLAGWRRVIEPSAVVQSITMTAISGSMVSIFFGIISAVLGQTLFITL